MAKPKSLVYNAGGKLLCNNPGCRNELCYLSPEERAKQKGRVTLYCPHCGLKHFGDVAQLRALAGADQTFPKDFKGGTALPIAPESVTEEAPDHAA